MYKRFIFVGEKVDERTYYENNKNHILQILQIIEIIYYMNKICFYLFNNTDLRKELEQLINLLHELDIKQNLEQNAREYEKDIYKLDSKSTRKDVEKCIGHEIYYNKINLFKNLLNILKHIFDKKCNLNFEDFFEVNVDAFTNINPLLYLYKNKIASAASSTIPLFSRECVVNSGASASASAKYKEKYLKYKQKYYQLKAYAKTLGI